MTGTTNVTRVAVAGVLVVLGLIGGQLSALLVSVIVAALLSALAAWELRARGGQPAVDAAWAPRRRHGPDCRRSPEAA